MPTIYIRSVYKVGGSLMVPLPPGFFRDVDKVSIEILEVKPDEIVTLRLEPHRPPHRKDTRD